MTRIIGEEGSLDGTPPGDYSDGQMGSTVMNHLSCTKFFSFFLFF